MKIYTKQGDTGETGLLGGVRVTKDHARIQAYGTLDELNAHLGTAIASAQTPAFSPLVTRLTRVQGELFQLGAELATPSGKPPAAAVLGVSEIEGLEHEIDEMEKALAPLRSFILPGGSMIASLLHVARTVSRRAERETVLLHRSEPVRAEVLRYVNRLSDYLFVCARFANHLEGVADVPWKSS